jgi:UDP-N-acetylglucosamine/UDP-N-acetylgalactosamine diphosphorylase
MDEVPALLKQRIHAAGQQHVLAWWPILSVDQRVALVEQLEALDLDLLGRLYAERNQNATRAHHDDRVMPISPTATDAGDRTAGEDALRRGEVAVLIVAGGQGTRLGFDHPKGMYPIGPVRETSLFQILAEKTLATQRRFGKTVPFLVMTSPVTHDETVSFFERHRHFGLHAEDVVYFRQGTMPALDLATGKLLLEAPSRLFLSPNGHGGTLLALAQEGLLDSLEKRGIRHIFYCQVDNPLVKVADPFFIGHHIRARAEVSTKAVPKNGPFDKVGNLVHIEGRCGIIEYSDLPESLARQTHADGRLRIRAGNAAIHVFDRQFLQRITKGKLAIPFHLARKKVPYLNEKGETVEPAKENSLKFEMFIFDVLRLAERWTVVEIEPDQEFHPLKNAEGADCPATVKQAISNLAGNWLEQAGASVHRQPNGDVAVPLEISPLFALDAEELRGKVPSQMKIAAATYFG